MPKIEGPISWFYQLFLNLIVKLRTQVPEDSLQVAVLDACLDLIKWVPVRHG